MSKPMAPVNIRELDAFFDTLPPVERVEAANYGAEVAKRNLDAVLRN
jgi:hypothetical protein